MIRAVWQSFWGELSAPSSFPADPYGALTNQAGHLALGFFLSSAAALIASTTACAFAGEMPFRLTIWAAVTVGYLVLVEWLQGGWSGADSVIDTAFVSLGAAFPLAALKEVSFQPRVILEARPMEGLSLMAVIVAALAAYVYPRAVRKMRGLK